MAKKVVKKKSPDGVEFEFPDGVEFGFAEALRLHLTVLLGKPEHALAAYALIEKIAPDEARKLGKAKPPQIEPTEEQRRALARELVDLVLQVPLDFGGQQGLAAVPGAFAASCHELIDPGQLGVHLLNLGLEEILL